MLFYYLTYFLVKLKLDPKMRNFKNLEEILKTRRKFAKTFKQFLRL